MSNDKKDENMDALDSYQSESAGPVAESENPKEKPDLPSYEEQVSEFTPTLEDDPVKEPKLDVEPDSASTENQKDVGEDDEPARGLQAIRERFAYFLSIARDKEHPDQKKAVMALFIPLALVVIAIVAMNSLLTPPTLGPVSTEAKVEQYKTSAQPEASETTMASEEDGDLPNDFLAEFDDGLDEELPGGWIKTDDGQKAAVEGVFASETENELVPEQEMESPFDGIDAKEEKSVASVLAEPAGEGEPPSLEDEPSTDLAPVVTSAVTIEDYASKSDVEALQSSINEVRAMVAAQSKQNAAINLSINDIKMAFRALPGVLQLAQEKARRSGKPDMQVNVISINSYCSSCKPMAEVVYEGKSTMLSDGDSFIGYKVDIKGDRLQLVDGEVSHTYFPGT